MSSINGARLDVVGINKSYDGNNIIRDCTFTLEPGKLTVMIGPSGCGKSSIIKQVAGFEKPDSGSILLNKQVVTHPGKDRLVVFQETALFPWMRTLQNVRYGPTASGDYENLSGRIEELLQRVGLGAFKRKYPSQLSGGMQRRAELARAMICDPQVMILDEPFRGLDAMTRELMWEYYANLFEDTQRTNLFITTDIDEAIFLADKLLIMANKPTRVCAEIDVDLPRPRKLDDMVWNKKANEIKKEALYLLHDEVMKSFGTRGDAAKRVLASYG